MGIEFEQTEQPQGQVQMPQCMEVKKTRDKVCIVGCASSKTETPFDKADEYEFWGVNNLYLTMPDKPWSRWFEIHRITHEDGKWLRRGSTDFRGSPVNKYLQGLGKLKCPVYMQLLNPLVPGDMQFVRDLHEMVPNAVPYPLKQTVESFGPYFTNTVSWEIALAISEGFKEIRIYGVDMAVDCLAPQTRVLTERLEWVQSGDVKEGDVLLGFDENPTDGTGATRKWRRSRVMRARTFKRDCYRIGLEDGTEFIATAKHGWLTHGENCNRWKTTDQLVTTRHRKGRPTRILRMLDTWTRAKSWDIGYLAASFDGEGSLSQCARKGKFAGNHTCSLTFSQKDNAMLENVASLLRQNGYSFSAAKVAAGVTIINILGGRPEIVRMLGSVRPERLLDKFDCGKLGEFQAKKYVAVEECVPIGEQEVTGFETDAKTFVAEGMASHNSEYFWQRPSCEYFLGLALGRGIKIWIPDSCDLLKSRFLYGFQEHQALPFENKLMNVQKTIQQKHADAAKQLQFLQKQMDQYAGAGLGIAEVMKTWKNVTGA